MAKVTITVTDTETEEGIRGVDVLTVFDPPVESVDYVEADTYTLAQFVGSLATRAAVLSGRDADFATRLDISMGFAKVDHRHKAKFKDYDWNYLRPTPTT